MANAQAEYKAFLLDPDQESRRAELVAFFGPNANTFLKVYDRMRDDLASTPGGRPKFRLFGGGFEVAAFFLGPVWFFYRKMWIMAWVVVALLVLIAFVPALSRGGLVLGILLAGMAHRTYVQHAVASLQKMRAAGPLTPVAVQAAGGVSKPAGIVSGVVVILLGVLGIVSIVYLAAHGVPPR